MLTDTELTQLRADILETLPDEAIIYAQTYASDGGGGWTAGSTAAGTVACRLDPLTDRELSAMVAGRDALLVRYRLTVPHDAPLAPDVLVEVGGSSYEVIEMRTDHSLRAVRRAIVSEVR